MSDRDDTPRFRIKIASRDRDIERCIALRRAVLSATVGVEDLGAAEPQDRDATHFLAVQGDQTVGTARLRVVAERTGRIDHVAVADGQRGSGVGRALMSTIRDRARAQGLTLLRLPAHEEAIPFYEALGYALVGEPFVEHDVTHRWLELVL